VTLPAAGAWVFSCDKELGWLRVSDDANLEVLDFVEFSRGCLAGLRDGELKELWLHFEWAS
jgi:hypothetical protein